MFRNLAARAATPVLARTGRVLARHTLKIAVKRGDCRPAHDFAERAAASPRVVQLITEEWCDALLGPILPPHPGHPYRPGLLDLRNGEPLDIDQAPRPLWWSTMVITCRANRDHQMLEAMCAAAPPSEIAGYLGLLLHQAAAAVAARTNQPGR